MKNLGMQRHVRHTRGSLIAICARAVTVALLLTVAGCGASSKTPNGGGAQLAITSHVDGGAVAAADIVVAGTAPASAKITRAIPGAPDDHTTADATGAWSMPVHLSTGPNELTFRIDSDKSSAVAIHITFDPLYTPPATPSAVAGGTNAPTASSAATFTAEPSSALTVRPSSTVMPTQTLPAVTPVANVSPSPNPLIAEVTKFFYEGFGTPGFEAPWYQDILAFDVTNTTVLVISTNLTKYGDPASSICSAGSSFILSTDGATFGLTGVIVTDSSRKALVTRLHIPADKC
jgi:hypothetical protein